MASYSVNYVGPKSSIIAFKYDSVNKTLLPVSSHVGFETGDGWFAITIDGEYAMIVDDDGMLVGDVSQKTDNVFPRLDFMRQIAGINQRMSSLTIQGLLTTSTIVEQWVMPADSLNLYDTIAFSPGGVTTAKASEVWLMADESGNYVTDEGNLIRVRLTKPGHLPISGEILIEGEGNEVIAGEGGEIQISE